MRRRQQESVLSDEPQSDTESGTADLVARIELQDLEQLRGPVHEWIAQVKVVDQQNQYSASPAPPIRPTAAPATMSRPPRLAAAMPSSTVSLPTVHPITNGSHSSDK